MCHNTLKQARTPRLGLCHRTLTPARTTKAWAVSLHIDTSNNTLASTRTPRSGLCHNTLTSTRTPRLHQNISGRARHLRVVHAKHDPMMSATVESTPPLILNYLTLSTALWPHTTSPSPPTSAIPSREIGVEALSRSSRMPRRSDWRH